MHSASTTISMTCSICVVNINKQYTRYIIIPWSFVYPYTLTMPYAVSSRAPRALHANANKTNAKYKNKNKKQVPDDPSIKVLSKKKTAERTQHTLRSFCVPLRTACSPAATPPVPHENNGTGHADGKGIGGAGDGDVNITVPENLPVSVKEVVERIRSSLRSFKQVIV